MLFGVHQTVTVQFFLPLLCWHTFSSWSHKLFGRDGASEIRAPGPLCSELGPWAAVLLCVSTTPCVKCPWFWTVSSFLFRLMCRESVTNYLYHVLSVKGCSSFMKRNQADIFFSSPYTLQFSFLRNCLMSFFFLIFLFCIKIFDLEIITNHDKLILNFKQVDIFSF